jgi:hypothetical protein
LDDSGRRFELAGLSALAIETMSCDRQGTVQVVYLIAIQTNRLLAAPAESFRPSRMTEHDAPLIFQDNFDSLVFAGGIKNL